MAIAAWLPVALPAYAQSADEGPVIVSTEDTWEGFKLEPIHFAMDFLGRAEETKVRSPTTGRRRDLLREFRATGSAWTKGYIGHPNFFDLNLAGTFGLGQQFIDSQSTGRRERPIETIDEYDVSGVLLQTSDFPTTIYSHRNHDYLNQQFGDTLDSLVTESGIQTDLRSATFPTSLHYFHRTEEQTSHLNDANFAITQDTFEWLSTWRPTTSQQVTWDYTLDNVTETGDLRQNNTFLRQHAIGTHELNFGDNDEHQLRSTFFGYNESGEIDMSRLRLDEALRLRHTPRFETLYNYGVDWSKLNEDDQIFQHGSAGFRHKLFESLWTSFDLGGSRLQMPDQSFISNQVFTNLDFDYRKLVPLGELSASAGVGLDYRADGERGTPLTILDEPHAFPASGRVLIQRQNITASSIVVTDSTGFITYVEGIDYTVQVFPDRIQITRILGGSIADGQAVLVDYEIGPEPAADTTTFTASGSVRYDFEESFVAGLGVYMRYLHQDQDRKSKSPDVILPANVEDITLGADYRIGYLLLSAEEQWHDSSLSPYEATRLNAQYRLPLGVGTALDATANYDMIDRTTESTTTTIATVKGRWTQRIDQTLSFALTATWRNETEDPSSTVEAFDQTFEIFWRYRQTSVTASVHNSFVNSNADDTSYLTVQLALRREF